MSDNLSFRLKLEIAFKNDTKGIVIEDSEKSGLDMDFDILKSYVNKPEPTKLTIYNMSKGLYNDIYQNAKGFRLFCARGREEEYKPFYTGYPIRSTQISKQTILTSNEGFMAQDANAGRRGQNDLETEITLMSYGFAQLFKSYRDNISTEIILKDCIDSYNLPIGNFDKINHTKIRKGFTCRGNTSKVLDWLGQLLGFYWNVNDMQFNLYDKNCQDIKTYGIVLTPENSSTPERLDDEFKTQVQVVQRASKKKGISGVKKGIVTRVKKGFKIKTQLLPFLQCGSTCYLKDFDIVDATGNKYIYKIHHVGNNYGVSAYSEIYCV